MKKGYFLLLFIVFATTKMMAQTSATKLAAANSIKLPQLDKSPMDMSYYPVNYPVLKIQNKATEPLVARVVYSRPQKDNRLIFGDIVEYNKVWRLGANEATEIEFYKEVKIGDKKLAKGRYTLYAIPTATQWTIIVNRETDIWGAFQYDEKKDVARVTVPVVKAATPAEAFTVAFNKSGSGADLVIAWDDVMTILPISFK